MFVLTIYPANGDILSVGKFVNITVGICVGGSKFLFVLLRRDRIQNIIWLMDRRADILRERSAVDVGVRRLCAKFYWQQRILFLAAPLFEVTNLTLLLVDSMFPQPKQMVIGDYIGQLGTPTYYLLNVLQYVSVMFVDLNYLFSDFLLGGVFQEIVKELSIVHYDLRKLAKEAELSSGEKYERLIGIVRHYQEIVAIQREFNALLGWYLSSYLAATSFMIVFVCVELSILANEDVSQCAEPLFYIVFVKLNFFYWCWLGQSMLGKSQGIASAAAGVYDPERDDKKLRTLLVMMQQMLNTPIEISVPPLFAFNYQLFVGVSVGRK